MKYPNVKTVAAKAYVMPELGIDISGHRSKSVDEFTGQEFDCLERLA